MYENKNITYEKKNIAYENNLNMEECVLVIYVFIVYMQKEHCIHYLIYFTCKDCWSSALIEVLFLSQNPKILLLFQ
jgi:hypothetical protein